MPQIRFRDAGNTLRTAAQIRARDDGNILRVIKRWRQRDDANVLQTVFDITTPVGGSGDVQLSTYSLYEHKNSSTAQPMLSETVTSLVTFGTPPYTYNWTFVSGTTGIRANDITSPNTNFIHFSMFGVKQAVYKLVVTDSLAAVQESDPITIEFEVS